jgi:predicted HAD superfamily Cof-like phosphohydrolase
MAETTSTTTAGDVQIVENVQDNKRKEEIEHEIEKPAKKLKEKIPYFKDGMSEFEMVHHFTTEAIPHLVPSKPVEMTKENIDFITQMITSELVELRQTIVADKDEAIEAVKNCVGKDVKDAKLPTNKVSLMKDQYDALIDIIIYSYNQLVRSGVDARPLLKEVIESQMAKKGPDGKFIIRKEDNKIMKPEGWQEPDLESIILQQLNKQDN